MNNLPIKTCELYRCDIPFLFPYFAQAEYPWLLLPRIEEIVEKALSEHWEGYSEISPGVLVGQNVKIAQTATIIPPVIIMSGTEIRPGAYIRGKVFIGENCVIGNSSELKNCILLNHVQVPHYNYVGDSILGNHAHMGAGSICSNLKSDNRPVVIHGEKDYPTSLRKVGAFLGDDADLGCHCVCNPGTIVGKNTSVYPLTSLRGVYPENSIVKSQKTIVNRK